MNEKSLTNGPSVFSTGNLIIFKDITESYQVSVYDVNGVMLKSFIKNEDGAEIVITQSPVVIVKLVSNSGSVFSTKVIRN